MKKLRWFAGHGFADVRKKRVVSKYQRVVAKEKKDLGAWNAKLQKIYAETESTVDDDPLARFSTKKKRKKDVSSSGEPEKETATAAVCSDGAPSQSSEAHKSSKEPSTTFDNLRLASRISGSS